MSFKSFINSFAQGLGFGMLYGNPYLSCYSNPFINMYNPCMYGGMSLFAYPLMSMNYAPPTPILTMPAFNFSFNNLNTNKYSEESSSSVFNFDFSNVFKQVNQYNQFNNFSQSIEPINNNESKLLTGNINGDNSSVGDIYIKTPSQNDINKQQKVTSNPEASRNNGAIHKTWDKMSDAEMKQVYGNYDYDVTKPYTGTVEDLNKYLKDKGALKGKGEAFLKAQKQYGISATALIGICCHESGKGKKLCAANNVAGVRKFTGKGKWEWRKFSSVEECILYVANLIKSSYVSNPGNGKVNSLKKLYQINAKYCPGAETSNNARWASRVQSYAQEAELA